MTKSKTPVRPIKRIVYNSDKAGYSNRVMMGTPTRGTVRIEWHSAVRAIATPPNWSMVSMNQAMSTMIPIRFQVADAQNIIAKAALERDFEWCLFIEDDTIPPTDLFIRLNQYMVKGDTPVISGLYFTKGNPSEPLIYRGRGTGSFFDWEPGELVWADGVPTGCLLVHHSILQAMWDESEEYTVGNQTTRRIFESPFTTWVNMETGDINTSGGTSDLNWCTRILRDDIFAKAGWDDYVDKEYPFLVDTNIRCWHITLDGEIFPPPLEAAQVFEDEEIAPVDLGVSVKDESAVGEKLG